MPGKIGVKIKAGRNLPVMDRGSDTTDAYVEIKLGNVTHKTDVCRKSLNPQWNTDWFRFEVDDSELQDEPLQIRLMDYDTYSANDAIGKVNISLNPLCLETSGQATQGKATVLSGWIPVFDTMHGIRGEVNVIVKVDLFSDLNKFRQSSCGIPFFHSPCIPFGYRAQVIHGFVEELVVNDDPEYQWIDKIRTPRASNEARQVVFLKLSGQVQRKMGLKAINMGANAVIGYAQSFDLEGDVGVVARGIGTAVTLTKETNTQSVTTDALIEERTLKYLEFLTCSGMDFSENTEFKFHINKLSSSTLFGFRSASSEMNDTDIMLDLIKQEDERGEKPIKKLKHHMRRLTRSSRNILSEKCASIRRKIVVSDDSKSPDNTSRSLNSIFSKNKIKDGSVASTYNSIYDVRKSSFKAKNRRINIDSKVVQRESFKKSHHAITRSVSDDADMLHSSFNAMQPKASKVAIMTDYQENTRSSPQLCPEDFPLGLLTLDDSSLSVDREHLLRQCSENEPPSLYSEVSMYEDKSYSSLDGSTETEEDKWREEQIQVEEKAVEVDEEEEIDVGGENEPDEMTCINVHNMERFLKSSNIDDYDPAIENWIKPGQTRQSIDECLPDSKKGHSSMLQDLKTFSQHIQELIHKPKKKVSISMMQKRPRQQTTNDAVTPPLLLTDDCKSYYSSQPELLIDYDNSTNMLALPATPLVHSRSLNNLTIENYANTSAPVSWQSGGVVASVANTPVKTTVKNLNLSITTQSTELNFPILQIFPSTPTPSESDKSEIFVDEDEINIPTTVVALSRSLSVTTLSPLDVDKNRVPCPQNNAGSPVTILNKYFHIDKLTGHTKTTNKHCNNINSSLLAQSINSNPLLCIKKHCHHRSLNEINASSATGSGAITDSPSMKRFASPASAAIVAAAATAMTTPSGAASTYTATTVGSALSNNRKMSPSASKLTINTSSSSGSTQSQVDSIFSTTTNTASTVTTAVPREPTEGICRRSSDSDLSVTPKGNSLCVASERLVAATALMRLSQSKNTNADGIDMLEYPFLTMTRYPPGFILHLGATVAARSVKLLERVPNPDEPEIRDSWWTELRMEIRSHARALGCNVVLGYSETTTISDEVCVLSATGTAAVINMAYNRSISQTDILPMAKSTGGVSATGGVISASLEERDMFKDARNGVVTTDGSTTIESTVVPPPFGAAVGTQATAVALQTKKLTLSITKNSCNVCHIPYNLASVPFNVKMKKCAICRKGRVPDVLLATLEVPEYLQVTGRGCFMQAQVVRSKKDLRSELNAKEISDGLPFLEYELHRVLINKLKAKGMNAIFGLRAQVAIGERMIALIATGTALFLTALPVPHVPKIVAGNSWTDKQKLNELQKKLQDTFERNQEVYQLKCIDPDSQEKHSDTDESDDEVIEIDFNCGNKDACVLEVDDIEDLEIISLLMEPYPPEGFHVVNTQMVPGMTEFETVKSSQMFTQVWRAKLDVNQNMNGFPKLFQRILQTIYFKLRTMVPCAICDLRFRLDLPESDQIQILVTGMAVGLGDTNKFKYRRKNINTNGISDPIIHSASNAINLTHDSTIGLQQGNKRALQEEDYIFPLDEDQMVETPTPTSNIPPYGAHSFKLRKTSPSRISSSMANAPVRNRCLPLRDRYGVDITPLSFIPGGRIEKYLGNLNFFFIRESTSIRENGGISGFVHGFITELLAVVRAHISALGGNAMVSFYMTELILVDNQHKNQGQCLISIGGDAVYAAYYSDD